MATAAILLPLVVAAVVFLPTPWVAVAFAVIVVAAAWEWAGLAGWPRTRDRVLCAAAAAIVLGVAYPLAARSAVLVAILVGGLCWWAWALYWAVRYERGAAPLARPGAAGRSVAGLLTLVPAWAALVALHGDPRWGPGWLLYVLVVVWCADIGAYFAGTRWGRRRLAPSASPGKTWEGAAGAVAAVAIVAVAVAYTTGTASPVGLVALSVAAVPVSILGDLTESRWKREAGVKDSGTLLPGHGGVLDRIDSLTAAAPFIVLGLVGLEALT